MRLERQSSFRIGHLRFPKIASQIHILKMQRRDSPGTGSQSHHNPYKPKPSQLPSQTKEISRSQFLTGTYTSISATQTKAPNFCQSEWIVAVVETPSSRGKVALTPLCVCEAAAAEVLMAAILIVEVPLKREEGRPAVGLLNREPMTPAIASMAMILLMESIVIFFEFRVGDFGLGLK